MAPIDDFGLVDRKAGGVGRLEARCVVADRAVDVGTAPHVRHTRWWWLSPTRVSKRAGEPGGSMRRNSPATVSARSPSYTAWVDTDPIAARTPAAIVSVSVWSANNLVVHGETLAGDLQSCVAQGLGVSVWRRRHCSSTQSQKLERVKKRMRTPASALVVVPVPVPTNRCSPPSCLVCPPGRDEGELCDDATECSRDRSPP